MATGPEPSPFLFQAQAEGQEDLDLEDVDREEDFFIFYKDRKEWRDIRPLAQYENPISALCIEYSPKFLDVYDHLRAVMAIGEKSKRVLDLTADAIACNAANYSVWQYRRDVLQALRIPSLMTKNGLSPEFNAEFDFIRAVIEENQKNYQVWHHRKILVSWAAGCLDETRNINLECEEAKEMLLSQELDLTLEFLSYDAKNYHVWQHRQWVVQAFQAYVSELVYTDTLIQADVRNNSAWTQRYMCISGSPITKELIELEVDYTWRQILKAPSNESSWTYLEGILKLNKDDPIYTNDRVYNLCKDLYFNDQIKTIPMLSFTLNMLDNKLSQNSDGKDSVQTYNHAIELCEYLGNESDVIRTHYWKYFKGKLTTKFGDKLGKLRESQT